MNTYILTCALLSIGTLIHTAANLCGPAIIDEGYRSLLPGGNSSYLSDNFAHFMQSDAHPYHKSHYCRIMAFQQMQKNNIEGVIISLCNEISISYHEGITEQCQGHTVFPSYTLLAVHKLCELFVEGHLEKYAKIYAGDPEKEDFYKMIRISGYLSNSPHAVHLLAQNEAKSGNFQQSLQLYQQLPAAYAQTCTVETVTAKLQCANLIGFDEITKTLQEIKPSTLLLKTVLEIVKTNPQPNILKAISVYIFKNGIGGEKAQAAYDLSLLETNPSMSDIYLRTAAIGGHKEASFHAFDRGNAEPDLQKSLLFYEAAGIGGRTSAFIKCALISRDLAEQTSDPQKRKDLIHSADQYMKKAAQKNNLYKSFKLIQIGESGAISLATNSHENKKNFFEQLARDAGKN